MISIIVYDIIWSEKIVLKFEIRIETNCDFEIYTNFLLLISLLIVYDCKLKALKELSSSGTYPIMNNTIELIKAKIAHAPKAIPNPTRKSTKR